MQKSPKSMNGRYRCNKAPGINGYWVMPGTLLFQGLLILTLLAGSVMRQQAKGEEPSQSNQNSFRTPLADLSLEELANLEVFTVSKRLEGRSESAAAIYVLTGEDLRRAGVTNIPDALRLVPGVQVAQTDSNTWAVGVRGFASNLSRSLLVLMDGRSVYSPLFAGTFWDVQSTVIEDIDRIEVIRGPGGTTWGANAVNGVINIITKPAKATQGALAMAAGGNVERSRTALRYGGSLKPNLQYRIYSLYSERGAEFHENGSAFDDWRVGQGGFRVDWTRDSSQAITVQGDLYAGKMGQRATVSHYAPPFQTTVIDDIHVFGGNILTNWTRSVGSNSDLRLQFFYDHTKRQTQTFAENRDTFDLDFQSSAHFEANVLTWGAGYRGSSSLAEGISTVQFDSREKTDHTFSAFAQQEFGIIPQRVRLTIGSKLEHNSYSGFEFQPTGLALWTPTDRQTVWASISRAVRTPSRVEWDVAITRYLRPFNASVPLFARQLGSENFQAEKMVAYEAGFRHQATNRVNFDLTGFLNQHSDLLSLRVGTAIREDVPPPTRVVVPVAFANGLSGRTHGAEIDADWKVLSRWRLVSGYSYMQMHLKNEPNSMDLATAVSTEGSSPRHQFFTRSLLDLPHRLEFDWTFRLVSDLPAQSVSSYRTADARIGWNPVGHVSMSLIGRNLFDPNHAEFAGGRLESQVRRQMFGQIILSW